jgi:ankyrin repeat protein
MHADDKNTATLLEEKGVDMDEKDMEGKTPLDIAEMNDQSEMVHYIKGKTYFRQTCVCRTLHGHFSLPHICTT